MKMIIVLAGLILGVVVWRSVRSNDTGQIPAAGEPVGSAAPSFERSTAHPGNRSVTRPDPSPSDTGSLSEPVLPAGAEVGHELTVAERRVDLQARFIAQGADPTWESTARQELGEDLGRFASKEVRVQDVECRSSLCRAELVLTSHEAGSTFMEAWLRRRAWSGPGFVANDEAGPDGAPRMIMFLGRPGTELPRLDQSISR